MKKIILTNYQVILKYHLVILTLLFLCRTLTSQSVFTYAEYLDALPQLEELNEPIVGLYELSGNTYIYEGDSLISKNFTEDLGEWYVLPVTDSTFSVYHSEFEEYQGFQAVFKRDNDCSYSYATLFANGEAAFGSVSLEEFNGIEFYSVHYEIPPKKALEIGGELGQTLYWQFYWVKSGPGDTYYQLMEKYADEYSADLILQFESRADSGLSLEDEYFQSISEESINRIRSSIDNISRREAVIGSEILGSELASKFIITNIERRGEAFTSYYVIFDNNTESTFMFNYSHDPSGNTEFRSVQVAPMLNEEITTWMMNSFAKCEACWK